jgi:hypothetical protein
VPGLVVSSSSAEIGRIKGCPVVRSTTPAARNDANEAFGSRLSSLPTFACWQNTPGATTSPPSRSSCLSSNFFHGNRMDESCDRSALGHINRA